MKFAILSIATERYKKVFIAPERHKKVFSGRNSLSIITLGLLLSFMISPVMNIDDVHAAVCSKVLIPAITASSSRTGFPPSKAIDDNLSTRWSSQSAYKSWIQADLGSVKTVCNLAIAWYAGQTQKYSFTISVSTDGINFENVLSSTSSGTTSQYETYDFIDTPSRYVNIAVFRTGELDSGQTSTQISELAIYGASSSPPPPPPTPPPSSSVYDDFQSGTYSLSDGQTSPNGKWHNQFNGFGSSGVQSDGTTNNVFYMFPRTSTSSSETHSSAVETTIGFSNFELSFDVKTIKQLRQNSPPNAWETAWILFRQSDTWHFYDFLVKPNGIEFGKKDCNTCSNPVDGQQFLVTAGSPTLKIGSWSNWKITAVGNHITITVDGIKVIDYIDNTMSSKLGSGSIVLYNEDASVEFDNVKITPL
jgi:hypothetical protein